MARSLRIETLLKRADDWVAGGGFDIASDR
jgi:hypothetical protein